MSSGQSSGSSRAAEDRESEAQSVRPSKRGKTSANDLAQSNEQSLHNSKQPWPSRQKPVLSCGECRRLKLKCDRVFPCQSCVKRGCEGICPDGSLTAGRGSRYILANTEQLHEKIVRMSDRIRILEDALENLHNVHSHCIAPNIPPSAHPLLVPDLLRVKSHMELYTDSPPRTSSDKQNDSQSIRSNSHSPPTDKELDRLTLSPRDEAPLLGDETEEITAILMRWKSGLGSSATRRDKELQSYVRATGPDKEFQYARTTGPVREILAVQSTSNGTQQWSFPEHDMASMRRWDQPPIQDAQTQLYNTQQMPWLPNQLQTQQPGPDNLQPYLYWNAPQQ